LTDAAKVLDLENAQYGLMLRFLAQAFGQPGRGIAKRVLTEAATELMHVIVPIAELLTKMPASPQHPGQTAGMSFAMLRDVARVPYGRGNGGYCPSDWERSPVPRRNCRTWALRSPP
jgi:hypothetical protein